jgi:hypothetical protein
MVYLNAVQKYVGVRVDSLEANNDSFILTAKLKLSFINVIASLKLPNLIGVIAPKNILWKLACANKIVYCATGNL